MNRTRWSKKEIRYLRQSYSRQGAQRVATHLGRSPNSVVSKAMKLGIAKEGFRHWKLWEDSYLKRHYNKDHKAAAIARTLKRSHNAVVQRAQHLGLAAKGGKQWTEGEKAYLRSHYPDRTSSLSELASHLGRSITSLRSYAKYVQVRRPRHPHEWTKEEHEYLAQHYKTKRFKDIAEDLELSKDAVVLHANRYGIFRKPHQRLWTAQDLEYVRQHYATATAEEIGAVLGRTVQAIRQCAGRMGLQTKENWKKPANIAARVRKYKLWQSQQKNNHAR